MNFLGIVLLVLSGGSGLLAVSVIKGTHDPGIATVVGAFAIPVLLAWWGIVSLNRKPSKSDCSATLNPDTHVRCPECRELVRADAKLCKHCHTKLIPSQEIPS